MPCVSMDNNMLLHPGTFIPNQLQMNEPGQQPNNQIAQGLAQGPSENNNGINQVQVQSLGQNQNSQNQNSQNQNDPNPTQTPVQLSHTNNTVLVAEDAARKREVRLLKNREAARECRRKKKEYIKCLEHRVNVLEHQNKSLIDELKCLKNRYCSRELNLG